MTNYSTKSRTITTVLAFFLGGIGVHRFYVGKTGTGLLQILLTISIVGLIVAIPWVWIDIILAATGNFKDKDNLVIANW